MNSDNPALTVTLFEYACLTAPILQYKIFDYSLRVVVIKLLISLFIFTIFTLRIIRAYFIISANVILHHVNLQANKSSQIELLVTEHRAN